MLKKSLPSQAGIIVLTALISSRSDAAVPLESSTDNYLLQLAENRVESTRKPRSMLDAAETILPASAFRDTEWTELMPKEDLEALLNPPEYVMDVEDGSPEDRISGQIRNSGKSSIEDRYQQALTSTKVIPELDDRAIRIPGFIVPLEFDDKQTITQFFLVPWFGACIHMPPPPPNQIILVNYPPGFKLDALHTPFWISGILQTSLIENEMAAAAYSMQMQSFEVYLQK